MTIGVYVLPSHKKLLHCTRLAGEVNELLFVLVVEQKGTDATGFFKSKKNPRRHAPQKIKDTDLGSKRD
jgi:hypothetical protein